MPFANVNRAVKNKVTFVVRHSGTGTYTACGWYT